MDNDTNKRQYIVGDRVAKYSEAEWEYPIIDTSTKERLQIAYADSFTLAKLVAFALNFTEEKCNTLSPQEEHAINIARVVGRGIRPKTLPIDTAKLHGRFGMDPNEIIG